MSSSTHPFRRLLTYGRKYRSQAWLASLCSLLNTVFDLAPPALIGVAIDIVVDQQNSILARWGVVELRSQFVLLSALTFLVWILESAFQYAYELLWRNLSQSVEHNLRIDAYGHVQNLELAYFEERSTGQLMSMLNDDINQLERFLDRGANQLIQMAATVLIIGAVFFALAPGLAWMALVPMPLIVGGAIAFQKFLAPRYADVRDKAGLINARLINNLTGVATIKSFTAEGYELDQLSRESQAYKISNRQMIVLSAAFIPLIRIIILIGFTGILFYGGLATAAGNLEAGTYTVLVFLTQRLLWPLTRLGETLDQYQRAMASTRRVLNLLDTPVAIHPGTTALPITQVSGEVIFENVSFGYHERQPILNNLSLKIPAGKTTAIVGATGSGKSTLVKLLLRFYEVNAGQIFLDALDVQSLTLEDLRKSIGLVSQDVFLFHGTVAENIAYGSFNATLDEITRAAHVAEAHDFIVGLPDGYDTIVGERGQKLSGGQRQRLAIARALLKNPPILVLDEATSAVDNETEAAIQKSLEKITKERTVIAIAHRLSTVRNAHCIYVMEQGKLVESGTHEQLLSKEGIYAGLWKVQTGEKVG
ncbi:ABC transporter ATP-binding protein [cf. Phormidesmis sp. LEGE 11477]|uniref:ABC transporter ATP-binding protein n=1 Tax=cf. Phormidesmis sp. LEGE 11477 TaxID=1828680 RepID=UPI00188279FE|nr:ABC transporter ATP-binding protein [cf. Phormidesmis sp. LEGE 11477]MBE9059615.1 ABC transporter ATP-binding protein [cf. Phormidesmis sp. LEGE 11477]